MRKPISMSALALLSPAEIGISKHKPSSKD
jgi:hypothetical protein